MRGRDAAADKGSAQTPNGCAGRSLNLASQSDSRRAGRGSAAAQRRSPSPCFPLEALEALRRSGSAPIERAGCAWLTGKTEKSVRGCNYAIDSFVFPVGYVGDGFEVMLDVLATIQIADSREKSNCGALVFLEEEC